MPLDLKNLKSIKVLPFVMLYLVTGILNAQQSTTDTLTTTEIQTKQAVTTPATAEITLVNPQKDSTMVKAVKDSVNNFKPIRVDGVSAVVGDFIILDSDVDKAFLQLEAQGANIKEFTRCQLFGKLLEDKLYAHHAIQDSIVVDDAYVRNQVNEQIESFVNQSGKSIKELVAFYNKSTEAELREEMFTINKNNQLAAKMQQKIVENVEITPDEVREFFNDIPKDERPFFGTELKVAQIVKEPKVSEENKQKAINELRQYRADVLENGASFRSKVVLYTDDVASRSNGGLYTLNRNQPRMVKEFREVAFSLEEGEISEPFETDFGYHIIQLEKIRGAEYDVRHILRIPEVSPEAIKEAREELESIRKKIVDGSISFADAARESSDEKETRSQGGQLINPSTQDYNFELTKMDPGLYAEIEDLKDGEVSLVLSDQDRTGRVKYKILTVTDRVNEHEANFSKDYLKIKQLALSEKKFKAVGEWQKNKIMDTYIKINDQYRSCKFSSNWLKQ